MKKLIIAILVLATTIKVNAQSAGKVSVSDINVIKATFTKMGPGQWVLSGANLKEGTNRLQSKELAGTLVFVKKGNSFSGLVFTDEKGKATRLTPTRGGANGAPTPTCKTTLPDACFGTADKSIGMCVCKPGDLSNGNGPYTFNVYQKVQLTISQ